MDGFANGVQQGGAAAHEVFLAGDGNDVVEGDAVVEQFILVIEERRGDRDFARALFLPLEHGIVAADGVVFQARHGTAAVQNHHKFRAIGLHKNSSHPLLDERIPHFARFWVACQATNGRRF